MIKGIYGVMRTGCMEVDLAWCLVSGVWWLEAGGGEARLNIIIPKKNWHLSPLLYL